MLYEHFGNRTVLMKKGCFSMRLVTMCLRNLTRRKLRSFLCILGVVVATCFIVAVGATTLRYIAIMVEMNTFFRGDVIVVARDVIVIQGFPIGGVIPQSLVDEIRMMDDVEKTVPILFIFGFKPGEVSSVLPVNVSIGLPVKEWSLILGSSVFESGGFPSENSADEVVVGCSMADQYGIHVGSKMNLRGREVTVCGIVKSSSAILGRSIIMSLSLAQEIYDYPMQVNMIVVEPKPNVSQEEVGSSIEEKISYVMALTEDERNDLTKPIVEAVKDWNDAVQVTLLFLSFVLVAVVGMMNVSERRRDFATLNAIGASSSYIFSSVVLENSLIGVLGGVLGVVFGSLIAVFLASFYTTIPLSQFVSDIFGFIPPLYMLEVFLAVVCACCVGGLVPAVNAVRMRIAEVLRAEY